MPSKRTPKIVNNSTLPDYDAPPIVEVVCGIQFKELKDLATPHIGLLWQQFHPEYMFCRELPPLSPVIERFSPEPAPSIQITQIPPLPRIWFLNEDESEIVQFQKDRLLVNWKKVGSDQPYPRYKKVFELFQSQLDRLCAFVRASSLGKIEPIQYEMTYVNLIPAGEGWKNYADVGSLVPDFSWRRTDDRFLPPPETLNWSTSFAMPEEAGRLHISILSAAKVEDQSPVLQLTITARGISKNKSLEHTKEWFDQARVWIVKGFEDMTSETAQLQIWKKKNV